MGGEPEYRRTRYPDSSLPKSKFDYGHLSKDIFAGHSCKDKNSSAEPIMLIMEVMGFGFRLSASPRAWA
jgi:hypothetical protein